MQSSSPNPAEARILTFARVFSAAMCFVLHVLFFERLAAILKSEMFQFAVSSTGALAWILFVGIPITVSLAWAWKISWPITSRRHKALFIGVVLLCHVLPATIGAIIGLKGMWN